MLGRLVCMENGESCAELLEGNPAHDCNCDTCVEYKRRFDLGLHLGHCSNAGNKRHCWYFSICDPVMDQWRNSRILFPDNDDDATAAMAVWLNIED